LGTTDSRFLQTAMPLADPPAPALWQKLPIFAKVAPTLFGVFRGKFAIYY
jgi:hypothetical protein